ncbi:hypothetical protein [Spirosoma validum]|uniref:Uncharacterized protein n=1 Tax=Spirosoma validum TaxID=2771355 RepID=A0A927B2K2_9BACT|nr:hypothetical protein [Spirosoma validum]MBD2754077.1 hypothetical protein [Spirosoma validum]
MVKDTKAQDQLSFDLENELSIVELEDRFELTAAAMDSARCSENSGQLQAS